MLKEEKQNVLEKAVNTFGENLQLIKAIEELGELSTALARVFTKEEAPAINLFEEIADVEIMLEQLKIIYKDDAEKIERLKEMKLNRLKGLVW